MLDDFLNRIRNTFGKKIIEPGLFYKWPIGLRFELGGNECEDDTNQLYTQRFYQAMYRSKTLLEHVFEPNKSIIIALNIYTKKKNKLQSKTQLKKLEQCGFVLPVKHHFSYEPFENGYFCKILLSEKINSTNVHSILWAIISNEIGIKPTAEIMAYFIDLDSGIVAHPYDDRGIDIVANSKEALDSCYMKYKEWLLNYDRKKIDAIFK